MKVLTMTRILEYIQTQGFENVNLQVAYQNTTIFTTAQIFNEFAFNYSSYKIPLADIFADNAGYFISLWQEYVNNTVYNLYRAVSAMQKDYDPIANYDMTETGADGTKLSKETTTPHGGTKTETEVRRFGIDSDANGSPYDKSEVKVTPMPNANTEREYLNNMSVTFDGTTHNGYHEGKEHFLKRSGNVGVTTNAQLLTGEIEVRKHDLLREYVKTFINRYAYCVGGVDE